MSRKRARKTTPAASRGFSITELVVVVGIVVVVSAIALPSILQSWNTYRLTRTAENVAAMLKRARFEAVRANTIVRCRGGQVGDSLQVWVDLDNDTVLDATEPQFVQSGPVQFVGPGVAPSPSSMGYPNAQTPAGEIAFDGRGAVNFGGNPQVVYVVYFGYANNPSYGYRAVTVLPLSSTRVWTAAAGGPWQ